MSGFSLGLVGAPSWADVASAALSVDDAGSWTTQNLRQVINSSQIAFAGAMAVRVTLAGAAANSNVISSAYIGHAAASGDPYDFSGTPVQLLFGGSAGVTVPAGGSSASDPASFVIGAGSNVIVSIKLVSGSNLRALTTKTGWTVYYHTTEAANTVDASGFAGPYSLQAAMMVSKIEGLR